ncbi:hypothetical protein B0H21DRAFT_708810 [Amylocystis lapponica]|nr:hypothetical protein B0H21DRAFT_708810 [Amylocystis lapponica]
MHSYSYSQDRTDGQNPTQQRSLSSATDLSPHLSPPSLAQPTGVYPPRQQYHPSQSQYTAMQPSQSSSPPSQRHSYYTQSATHPGAQVQYANVTPPGQTLRDLPFSNAHPMAVPYGQGTGVYAQPTPRTVHRAPSHASLTQPVQYSSAPVQPQGIQYIPTPAQTMQTYQNTSLSTRGGVPSTIVLSPASSSPGVERYSCDKCERTFGRPHDRKRHNESQHQQISHICPGCEKFFSRQDSLKRHLDNGCDRMPL